MAPIQYSFPNMTIAAKRQLNLKLDGSAVTTIAAPEQSGVWEADINTTCWASGTHILTVEAVSLCEPPKPSGPASTAIVVNTTPTVSISYSHDQGTISVPYDFPNTNAPAQRQLNLQINGQFVKTIAAPQLSGVWEEDFDITCLSRRSSIIRSTPRCRRSCAATWPRPGTRQAT
jgi:hypothetical protein